MTQTKELNTVKRKASVAAATAFAALTLMVAAPFTGCGTASNIKTQSPIEYRLQDGAAAKSAVWASVRASKAEAIGLEAKSKECTEYSDVCLLVKKNLADSKKNLLLWLENAERLEDFIENYPGYMHTLGHVTDLAKTESPEKVKEALKKATLNAVEQEL